jgi:hypothetical protein
MTERRIGPNVENYMNFYIQPARDNLAARPESTA